MADWFSPIDNPDAIVSNYLARRNASPNVNGTLTAQDFQWGMNPGTFQVGFQGLQALGNLWGAFQANKLAKDQLKFTKRYAATNLANQAQSYNTALEDRARTRAIVEGRPQSEADEYVRKHRISGSM